MQSLCHSKSLIRTLPDGLPIELIRTLYVELEQILRDTDNCSATSYLTRHFPLKIEYNIKGKQWKLAIR